MAILGDKNGVNIEAKFTESRNGYIYYNFRFLYGGKPLFNPSVTKREFVECDEYEKDTLIPFLEQVLAMNEGETSWHPLELDFFIEFHPYEREYEIIFFVSPLVQFNDLSPDQSRDYGEDEAGVKLYVDRNELKIFTEELKAEYKKFLRIHKGVSKK